MPRARSRLAAALIALVHAGAMAMTGAFYQPQLRDRAAGVDWPAVFAELRADGIDTLVVQWTRHGDAFAAPEERAWLSQRLHEARDAGLRLVVGLGADPGVFDRQRARGDALSAYLDEHGANDEALARSWVDDVGAAAIAGWYLPLEIDDVHWRSEDALDRLYAHLAVQRAQLERVLDRPVHVSLFVTGHMAPSAHAAMARDLARLRLRTWVQDGAGTRRLLPAERQLYLDALAACGEPVVHGVIHEVFVQRSGDDEPFRAEPMPAAEAREALRRRSSCGLDTIFFSLRYLPAGRDLPR